MSWRVRVALVGDLDGHVEIHVHLLETSLSIRPSLSSLYEISGATGLDGGVVRLMVERRDLVGEETYGLAATWLVPQSTRL